MSECASRLLEMSSRLLYTNAKSVFGFRTKSPAGRRYRVVWTAPDGTEFVGPGVRSYR